MTPAASAITGEEALALFGRARAGEARNARIIGQKQGAINQIFHIEADGQHFALRVRYNESNFQYEKGVFKEAIAALLINSPDERNSTHLDEDLSNACGSLAGGRSGERIAFPCGADIIYFDFTYSIYTGPWAILEWTGDTLASDFAPAHAFQLGRLVSNIHCLKFRSAYRTFHDIRAGGIDIVSEWQDEILRRNRNTGQTVAPDEALRKKLASLAGASRPRAPEFVLCHNDLHCLNITQKQGTLYLLDWDNAQIAPKELDFVKLAHWSRLGPDGRFEPDAAIFASFCEGYGPAAVAAVSSPIFKLAELVWLFRVLEFALVTDEPPAAPFWPPQRYAALLRDRLASV